MTKNGVLIIDDDEDDCKIIEECLYDAGVSERITYRIGSEAGLEFLASNANNLPKVIIIDLNMPRIDGMEALQLILPRYDVRVIMYSTTCRDNVIKEAKLLGAIDCVQKGSRYSENMQFAKRILGLLKEV